MLENMLSNALLMSLLCKLTQMIKMEGQITQIFEIIQSV